MVRSYSHDSDDHFFSQVYALSGRKVTTMAQLTTEPNIGSIVAKLQGGRAGFPGYLAVPGTTRPGPPPKNLFTGGWLGMQYAPFSTGGMPRNEDFTAKVSEASEEDFNQQVLTLPADVDARGWAAGARSSSNSTTACGRSTDRATSTASGRSSAAPLRCSPCLRCARPSTSGANPMSNATATAGRRSASAASWRGVWSRREHGS